MENLEGGFNDSISRQEYSGVKTLRMLTAKQLAGLEVDESSSIHRIDGAEVTNVVVVGHVTTIKNNTAGTMFTLYDTTGFVDVAFWANGAYDEMVLARVAENALLKVTGSVRVFAGKKTVSSSSISVVDTNYLVYHLTAAAYQSAVLRRIVDAPAPPQSPASTINADVLQTYRNNQDDNGLELDLVISMLKSKYAAPDVRDAIESLLTDCHLYSVDGTHYHTTL